MRFLLPGLCATFAALCGPLAAQQTSPPPPAPEQSWFREISVNGFLSAAYSYNFNGPASGTNAYRVFDFDDQTFKIDVAELVVQKTAANRGDAGFRLDMAAGASIPRVTAASGLFRDSTTGKAEDFDLQQAYVSWIAPVGRGLRFDVGKYVTHTGAEVIEGYDGANDNYSRSFLFGYAIPFTHTGVKVSYAFADSVSAMAMVVNGWDNVKDNNKKKSVGAQLTLVPGAWLTLIANYLGGAERDRGGDWRHLYDVVLVVSPVSFVKLTLNYDYARERNGAGPGHDAMWQGVAGIVRFTFSDAFALSVRGEQFEDYDGVRTGTAQRLRELTVTPEVKLAKGLVLRGEVRWDASDEAVFEFGPRPDRRQLTAALNAFYGF